MLLRRIQGTDPGSDSGEGAGRDSDLLKGWHGLPGRW